METGERREPSKHKNKARRHFMAKPDRRVGVIDTKVRMQEDSSRHTESDARTEDTDSSNRVLRRQVAISVSLLIQVDAVDTGTRQEQRPRSHHTVQLYRKK
jgi:hypothetical protein